MKRKIARGGVLLALFLGTSAALALDTPSEASRNEPKKRFATEFGKALPPVGFVTFCARSPNECKRRGGKPDKLAMSPDRWNLLYQVNAYVNGKIDPVSDQDLYGQPEYWAYPVDAGDCEDNLLLKRRYLLGLGFPPDALLITVVLDEKSDGHAVLTVTTEDGDYILDNRSDEVMRWSTLEYTFLKRQSAHDPRVWVSLVKDTHHTPKFVSGGSIRQQ